KTKPTISAGTASPAANANGWNNTNVTVTFSCSDPGGSGAVSATDVKTLSSEGANQSATGTCTDKAGNSNSATKSGISIDKTKPTVVYSGNLGTYAVDATVNITCTASDTGGSTLASSTCANITGLGSSFGPGPHTFSATATDKAGNTASASTTFTVGVTVAALCNQLKQWVQASAAYQKLKPAQKAIADLAWNAACQAAAKLPPLTPAQKQTALKVLKIAVDVLVAGGYLTPAQAQAIMNMAALL
ncbi:MAG TPA: hypothetical protein VJT84_14545, partial [Gaiellaceae bacterium]|nr:hypothetical protein [Gaiellaceae bacterium]